MRPRRAPLVRLGFNLLVLSLAVWFLAHVLGDIGVGTVYEHLIGASPALVVIILIANVARYALLGLRWEILVRREAPAGFSSITKILMAGNLVSLVTPVLRIAGPVLRAYYLSKETGRPRARFYGTIVADQAVNFSIFAAAMIVSGMVTAARGSTGLSVAAGGAMMFCLVGGLYVGWRHLQRFKRGEPSLVRRALQSGAASRALSRWERGRRARERLVAWWDHLLEALSHSLIGSGTWWPAVGVSIAIFLLLALAQQMACAAIGARIGFAEATFAVSAAGFIQILAAAPSGPGVTEASLVLIFLALGLDKADASAATFLARLANYAVLIPWGGWSFFRLQRQYGSAREAEAEEAPAA